MKKFASGLLVYKAICQKINLATVGYYSLVLIFFRTVEIVVRDVTFRNKALYFREPLSYASLNSNILEVDMLKFSLQMKYKGRNSEKQRSPQNVTLL